MGIDKLIIGVTGGSGSGKTQVVRQLEKRFDEGELCVLSMDNYYRPRDLQPVDDEGMINFDTLEALDYERLIADLKSLLRGETLKQEIYTFNNPARKKLWLEIKPANVILLEGLYALCNPEIRKMTRAIVFIKARKDQMLRRRIKRDNLERGYSLEDVVYRYEKHVMPAYTEHILPLKESADMVIENNGEITESVDLLYHWLKKMISEE